MEFAAVYEQLLNCQARHPSQNTVSLFSRESPMQSLRLSFSFTSNTVSLVYACVPSFVQHLKTVKTTGSRSFCAGFLAFSALSFLHDHDAGHRVLPSKQSRQAMLSAGYGFCDFVEFVVGFVSGASKQKSKIIFCTDTMCSFRLGTSMASLVFDSNGISLVLPTGDTRVVATPPIVFRNEKQYSYSGVGLDRYLYKVCIATAIYLCPASRAMLKMYHFVVYKPS